MEEKIKKKYPVDGRLKAFQLPVLGYIMFYLMEAVAISLISEPIDAVMPDHLKIGAIAGALLMLFVNWLWCRPDYRGMLSVKGLGKGLAMGAVIFGIDIALNFAAAAQSGLITSGKEFVKALVLALAAGIGEEVMFRGPGVANFMRVTDDERKIPLIFWISSLAFGLIHFSNLISGADFLSTVFQVVTATSAGMLFVAIFLRTGTLLPAVIFHTLIDLACFVSKQLLADGGVVTTSITVIDWIYLAVAIPGAIVAIRLISKKHRGEILAVWAERWSKKKE